MYIVRSSINWLETTTAAPAVSVYDVRSKRNSGSHSASTKDLIMQFSMWEIIDFCFCSCTWRQNCLLGIAYDIEKNKLSWKLHVADEKNTKTVSSRTEKLLFHHDVSQDGPNLCSNSCYAQPWANRRHSISWLMLIGIWSSELSALVNDTVEPRQVFARQKLVEGYQHNFLWVLSHILSC